MVALAWDGWPFNPSGSDRFGSPRFLSLPRVLSPEVPVGWRAKSRGFGCCDIKSAPRAGCVPSEIVQAESSRLEGGGRQVLSDGSV